MLKLNDWSDNMSLEDQFRYLVGAYYGVMEMDEYDLKVYILKLKKIVETTLPTTSLKKLFHNSFV